MLHTTTVLCGERLFLDLLGNTRFLVRFCENVSSFQAENVMFGVLTLEKKANLDMSDAAVSA